MVVHHLHVCGASIYMVWWMIRCELRYLAATWYHSIFVVTITTTTIIIFAHHVMYVNIVLYTATIVVTVQ